MQPDGLLSTLKHLRLHGMSQALQELVEQGSPDTAAMPCR